MSASVGVCEQNPSNVVQTFLKPYLPPIRLAHAALAREQMLWLLVHEAAIGLTDARVLIHLLLALFHHFSCLKPRLILSLNDQEQTLSVWAGRMPLLSRVGPLMWLCERFRDFDRVLVPTSPFSFSSMSIASPSFMRARFRATELNLIN